MMASEHLPVILICQGCGTTNPDGAPCYQDDLLGTDCSSEISVVRVIINGGATVQGVIIVPQTTNDAIIIMDNPDIQVSVQSQHEVEAEEEERREAAMDDSSDYWHPQHHESMKKAMLRHRQVYTSPEELEKMQRDLESSGRMGGNFKNNFRPEGGSGTGRWFRNIVLNKNVIIFYPL